MQFQLHISPSKEYSGLISFRVDWFDLLAVQGILKSLLQYHSSKASILWRSAFFIVQLSHPYMTTGTEQSRHGEWECKAPVAGTNLDRPRTPRRLVYLDQSE